MYSPVIRLRWTTFKLRLRSSRVLFTLPLCNGIVARIISCLREITLEIIVNSPYLCNNHRILPMASNSRKTEWLSDLWVFLWGVLPFMGFFVLVCAFVALWIKGSFFTTGIVDRPTVVPWSIGIGQIAFGLVAAALAIAVPRHNEAMNAYRKIHVSKDELRKSRAISALNRVHRFTAALIGLNFFVGMSAMSLDPFWWVLIQNHVFLKRYPLRDDYYYPELPLWMLGSLYLILVSVFLYLVLSAGSDVVAADSDRRTQ